MCCGGCPRLRPRRGCYRVGKGGSGAGCFLLRGLCGPNVRMSGGGWSGGRMRYIKFISHMGYAMNATGSTEREKPVYTEQTPDANVRLMQADGWM